MPKRSTTEDWLRLSTAAAFLWAESVTVIWLRSMLLLSGDPGRREEAVRMIAEKFQANADLAAQYAMKQPRTAQQAAQLSTNHYGSLVRANRKRLLDRRFARKLAGR